jgi:5-methylcytosine-specific restriction endonuclease McrA
MKLSLLLNNDYAPLNFVLPARALRLLLRGSAEVVSVNGPSMWDISFNSPSMTFKIPATLRLNRRVPRVDMLPRFKRNALFNRDNWQCQYCCSKLDDDTATIDHIVPKMHGGARSWKNCVTACKSCNIKKGCKSLVASGMKLLKNPGSPKSYHFWDIRKKNFEWHDDWVHFLRAD